jgi:hypothetical protein
MYSASLSRRILPNRSLAVALEPVHLHKKRFVVAPNHCSRTSVDAFALAALC